MTTKPNLTLSDHLALLIDDIYRDECFVAPEEWDIDEMCHLIHQAADALKEKGE